MDQETQRDLIKQCRSLTRRCGISVDQAWTKTIEMHLEKIESEQTFRFQGDIEEEKKWCNYNLYKTPMELDLETATLINPLSISKRFKPTAYKDIIIEEDDE